MAPWYEKAETKLGVTRTGDRAGLPGNNNYLVFEKGAKALGYKEVHTGRMAINSAEYDGRMACQQTGFCFQGCKWGAKWSSAYTDIPRGEATGNPCWSFVSDRVTPFVSCGMSSPTIHIPAMFS